MADIVLPGFGSVTGRVSLSSGERASAQVWLRHRDGSAANLGATGEFSLAAVRPDDYELTATYKDVDVKESIKVVAGEINVVDLTVPALGRLTGVLRNGAGGLYTAGMHVFITNITTGRVRSMTAGGSGTFDFDEVAPGTYAIALQDPFTSGYITGAATTAVVAPGVVTTKDVNLPAQAPLSVTVLDADRRPQVADVSWRSASYAEGRWIGPSRTDSLGRITFGKVWGPTVEVTATPVGSTVGSSASVAVTQENVAVPVEIVMPAQTAASASVADGSVAPTAEGAAAFGIVVGRVADSAGTPIGGSTVRLYQPPSSIDYLSVTAATDGTFRFDGVRDGAFRLYTSAASPGDQGAMLPGEARGVVRTSSEARVDLRLVRSVVVGGRYVSAFGEPMAGRVVRLAALQAPRPDQASRAFGVEVTTDGDGTFRAQVPEGMLRVGGDVANGATAAWEGTAVFGTRLSVNLQHGSHRVDAALRTEDVTYLAPGATGCPRDTLCAAIVRISPVFPGRVPSTFDDETRTGRLGADRRSVRMLKTFDENLEVAVDYFMPEDGGFVRAHVVLRNLAGTKMRVAVDAQLPSGYGRVVDSSSGDAALDATDTWAAFASDGARRVAIALVTGRSIVIDGVSRLTADLEPGQTKSFALFTAAAVAEDVERLAAAAQRLVALEPPALEGLSPAEKAAIVNLVMPGSVSRPGDEVRP